MRAYGGARTGGRAHAVPDAAWWTGAQPEPVCSAPAQLAEDRGAWQPGRSGNCVTCERRVADDPEWSAEAAAGRPAGVRAA